MRHLIQILALLLLFSHSCMAADLLLARISLDQATKQVIGNGKNRVLGAQTINIDGRDVHVIKVLTPDGRIHHYKIDAETGAVLG